MRKVRGKEQPTFLVVEGDGDKRSHVVDTLRELGYQKIEQAPDGTEAFHMLKRRPIDCVICARNLPEMSGLTLLKFISADEELSPIPFVIVTSVVDRETVMDAGKYGTSTVILEPVHASTLKVKINNILKGKAAPRSSEVNTLISEAQKLAKGGEYDKALVIYNRILEQREDAEIFFDIGNIYITQDKYDGALIAFRKAVMINGKQGGAFAKMGEVYLKLEESEKAGFCFQKAGDIFLDRDMQTAAENALKEVLKLNPNATSVYNSLGILYRKGKNFREAVRMYQAALKVDSDDENIYYNLGRALLDDGKIGDAKKQFQQALEIKPDFINAKQMLQGTGNRFK